MDFVEAERAVIGFSHPLIGAMVACKWQLPMSICNTILRCADPFEGIDNKQDEQIALIKLAATLSMCGDMGFPSGHPLGLRRVASCCQSTRLQRRQFLQLPQHSRKTSPRTLRDGKQHFQLSWHMKCRAKFFAGFCVLDFSGSGASRSGLPRFAGGNERKDLHAIGHDHVGRVVFVESRASAGWRRVNLS